MVYADETKEQNVTRRGGLGNRSGTSCNRETMQQDDVGVKGRKG